MDKSEKAQTAELYAKFRKDPVLFVRTVIGAEPTPQQVEILNAVAPERITIGTLRFEEGFHKMRDSFFTTGKNLCGYVDGMKPMFPPRMFPGKNKPKQGKYSFSEKERIEIFNYVISEIRKYSNCKIALCKESETVWKNTELELSECSCVCQYNHANM